MKKLISTTLFTILFSAIAFSQNITEFENVTNLITEDFTNAETAFPILTSVDNYFIIDNGDYLLSRNNTESEYAIIVSATQQVSDFVLKTAIKLGPSSNKKASCGIIIKSQTTGSGALIFEINRKGEYRIKELLVTNTYKYLSGKTSNDGWVRNKIIKKQDEFNSIKILNKENILVKSKAEKIKRLKKIYIPISFWIENKYKKKGETLILGFSGGQGSGKTTVTGILKIILKKFFKRRIHVSSIDDFYKTLEDRNKISNKIHPLLKTRGVPGTHDINLVKNFFNIIRKKKFKKIKLPKFEKAMDNRLEKKYWFNIKQKPEIVILEGWCVGAKPQSNSLIKRPINILEKYEDKDLKWRKYANKKLKQEYNKEVQSTPGRALNQELFKYLCPFNVWANSRLYGQIFSQISGQVNTQNREIKTLEMRLTAA